MKGYMQIVELVAKYVEVVFIIYHSKKWYFSPTLIWCGAVPKYSAVSLEAIKYKNFSQIVFRLRHNLCARRFLTPGK